MVKHVGGQEFVGSRFVVGDIGVFSVQCSVLDNIEVAYVYSVLVGVGWMCVEEIIEEGIGGGVALGGGV